MKRWYTVDYLKIYNEEHINNRLSLPQISLKLNISTGALRYNFNKLGLTTHKYNVIDYTGIRENAFDTWSPEMAYWLGFIASDGSVPALHNHISIILKLSDKEHLYKFKNFLNLPDASMTETVNNYRGGKLKHAKVGFTNKHIKERLISLGLVPAKSHYDIDFLSYVPYQFRPYFILGYFDGDGSYADKGINDPRVIFVGSHSFLFELKLFLHHQFGLTDVSIYTRERDNLCSVNWSKTSDVKSFAKLHTSLLNDLPLKRKLLTAKSIVEGDIYKNCTNCGVQVTSYSKTGLCSTCQSLTTRKAMRPTSIQLAQMLAVSNYSAIGRNYGVSGNAVKKWAKSYNLIN